jgi:hypothetical protein
VRRESPLWFSFAPFTPQARRLACGLGEYDSTCRSP